MTTTGPADGPTSGRADDAEPQDDVDRRLLEVFRQVFDDLDLVLTPATGPEDVAGWDSLGTVSLLYALEDEFGVEIDDSEVRGLSTVGAIRRRLSTAPPQP